MSRYRYFENYIVDDQIKLRFYLDDLVCEWFDKKKPVPLEQFIKSKVDLTDVEYNTWIKTGNSPNRRYNVK